MAIFNEIKKPTTRELSTDYRPTVGWHEARIVSLVDLGTEENRHIPGKMQPKISILFALSEEVSFRNGQIARKTHTERLVASLYHKSKLMSKYLTPAGIDVESLDELLGKTLRLKIVPSQCNRYRNVSMVEESEYPLQDIKGVQIPKYWLLDGEGNETGHSIISEEGVLNATNHESIAQAAFA